jgi:hypothetical protein
MGPIAVSGSTVALSIAGVWILSRSRLLLHFGGTDFFCYGLGGERACDRKALVLLQWTVFDMMYFSITSCSFVMVFGGFLASLVEHGPTLTPLVATRITKSSMMLGVLALSCTNLC